MNCYTKKKYLFIGIELVLLFPNEIPYPSRLQSYLLRDPSVVEPDLYAEQYTKPEFNGSYSNLTAEPGI
jgi:hypothetical protein